MAKKNSPPALAHASQAQAELVLDQEGNVLAYESDRGRGVIVNVSSDSLIQLYRRYAGNGLFDLNVRCYVRSKLVDEGVRQTLDQDRENFWFYNNGVIIACRDYIIQGCSLLLTGFSIVNGGQTVTLIANYKGQGQGNFFVPCHIVKAKNKEDLAFFTRIAAATAAQKPVRHSDLHANDGNLKVLQRLLAEDGIFLEIKRGDAKRARAGGGQINKDQLGKLILCVAMQRPGTARANGAAVFNRPAVYDAVFGRDYGDDPDAVRFLADLVRLSRRYDELAKDLLDRGLNAGEKEILRHGRQVLLALLGLVYALINGDVAEEGLAQAIYDFPLAFQPLFAGPGWQTDSRLKDLLISLTGILADSYTRREARGQVATAARYLGSDKFYQEAIVPDFAQAYSRRAGFELRRAGEIFRRR